MVTGQKIQFNLQQGSSIVYKHYVFCFGISSNGQNTRFTVYKCSATLQLIDSISVDLPKNSSANYLNFQADTLHDFLNIYLQEKNTNLVDVIRLDASLKIQSVLKKIEVARLNNSSLLGEQVYFLKNKAYVLKHASDSSGQQYYLNQYDLKSDKENFDYLLKWQYPFERKYIQFVEFLRVDSQNVNLFVKIFKGAKVGHYYLKIDTKTGKLIKATKLNEGNDQHYMPGANFYFSPEKSLWLFGQKLNTNQYKPENNYLATSGGSAAVLYCMVIDSLGELSERREYKIPIKENQTGNNKVNSSCILKMVNAKRLNNGNIRIEFDIFKNEMQKINCFYYCQTQVCQLINDGEKYQLEQTFIQTNLEIENFYRNKDPLNLNGIKCLDSVYQLNELYDTKLNMPVKLKFKSDDQNNGYWILLKNDISKKQIVIGCLAPQNKIYKLTNIENTGSDKNLQVHFPNSNNFVIGYQLDEKIFQLMLKQW